MVLFITAGNYRKCLCLGEKLMELFFVFVRHVNCEISMIILLELVSFNKIFDLEQVWDLEKYYRFVGHQHIALSTDYTEWEGKTIWSDFETYALE